MNVILFCQGEQRCDHFLSQGLLDLVPPDSVTLCQTVEDLVEKLRSQKTRPHVAVLCVHDLSTMESLVQTRELLDGVSLVLVLPHRDGEILNQAYLLRPRYIDFLEDNGERLSSVLERMIPVDASL